MSVTTNYEQNTARELLPESIYTHYVYSYPHKTAYRRFSEPLSIQTLWQDEATSNLFLYAHIPFCEFRCGFCNLFTEAQPAEDLPAQFLEQLRLESEVVVDQLESPSFSQIAVGGGTPTYLSIRQLEDLVTIIDEASKGALGSVPAAIECSPATIDPQKLSLLKQAGFDRISMGIQSFSPEETKSLGRPQNSQQVQGALEILRQSNFPTINLDLIYGSAGQTVDSFCNSIRKLLPTQPEEIFLYPLYVRPLTGLGRQGAKTNDDWDQHRLELYRAGRDILLEAGYRQFSMRKFRLGDKPENGSPYQCTADGMLGFGCGARSYTAKTHYSHDYAVEKRAIQAIIRNYITRDAKSFATSDHGIRLSNHERRRRHLLLSLLNIEGICYQGFEEEFGVSMNTALPELDLLRALEWTQLDGTVLKLTEQGLERSDQIGPFLFSPEVRRLMEEYECI